jgi:hypothetical protein
LPTCKHCAERPTELIAEGKAFMAQALKTCLSCDELKTNSVGIKQCGLCGCLVRFKILGGLLIKSQCPLKKW